MKNLLLLLNFLAVTLTIGAQPSVGLINTENTGPLGIGKRLLEEELKQIRSTEYSVYSNFSSPPTSCLNKKNEPKTCKPKLTCVFKFKNVDSLKPLKHLQSDNF